MMRYNFAPSVSPLSPIYVNTRNNISYFLCHFYKEIYVYDGFVFCLKGSPFEMGVVRILAGFLSWIPFAPIVAVNRNGDILPFEPFSKKLYRKPSRYTKYQYRPALRRRNRSKFTGE